MFRSKHEPENQFRPGFCRFAPGFGLPSLPLACTDVARMFYRAMNDLLSIPARRLPIKATGYRPGLCFEWSWAPGLVTWTV